MITLELPEQKTQTVTNLRRWAELLADRELAKLEGRIETDRHGRIILIPPAAPSHGILLAEVALRLRSLLPTGRVISACPISTADGVRAADIAWASSERMGELGDQVCFPTAPEICVEVLSPSNTEAEMHEKARLYFDAGAKEVWLCGQDGAMRFFGPEAGKPLRTSKQCPRFPKLIELT